MFTTVFSVKSSDSGDTGTFNEAAEEETGKDDIQPLQRMTRRKFQIDQEDDQLEKNVPTLSSTDTQ